MSKLLGCLVFSVGLLCVQGLAQPSVGLQAPLAAVAGLSLGPVMLEAGMPLRFDAWSAFGSVKWFLGGFSLEELTFHPFVGAGTNVRFADPLQLGWFGLTGFEVAIPDSGVHVFGQLGIWPAFDMGLLESFSLGVRLGF